MISLTSQPARASAGPLERKRGRLRRVIYAAMLDPGQKFGSMEEQMLVLAKEFAREGGLLYPLFLCPDGPGKTRIFDDAGLSATCLDMSRFRLAALKKLVRLIRANGIEAIHWNFTEPISNAYLWWLTMLTPRVKHFFTEHTSRLSSRPRQTGIVTRTLKRMLLKRYRKVVCVSEFVRGWLREEGYWSNLECRLHFVNVDRFRPDPAKREELRKEYGDQDRFVLLTVSNLIPEKGIDVALLALSELPSDAVLWVLGGGPDLPRLQALAAELGIDERVRFFGRQANVTPFMQAADCLLCPSLWEEAAGLSNIEGQGCGVPVVASRIGGIPEYVKHEETGMLFTPGDHMELARCVRLLQDSPELRCRLGRQARELVVADFSAGNRLHDMLDVYRIETRESSEK